MHPQSMTGYGRGIVEAIKVEARSTNHKHLDIHVRLPAFLYQYEPEIRRSVREHFGRGRIDVIVSRPESDVVKVKINESLAREYHQALRTLQEKLSMKGDISIDVLASYRDIFCLEEEANIDALKDAVLKALDELKAMRESEARHLIEDIAERLKLLDDHVKTVENRRDEVVRTAGERLLSRLQELLGNTEIDESRIVQETAILVEKSDITEEIVRIRSHLRHAAELLDRGGSIGKKLDFVTQELRREVNTIGSKTGDVELARNVVEMKHELEKIREQLQNLQ